VSFPEKMMRKKSHNALVLIEMLMVVGMIALITGIAMISFGALWGNTRFKSRAEELVNTFQMAYEAALQSDRRYAVVLDYYNSRYILRQFETLDFSGLPDDEAIIFVGTFDDDFQFDHVLYDDLENTQDSGEDFREARFYAGRAGWQVGGIVVVRDRDGNPWSIVIHRLGKPVQLVEGYADMLSPQSREKVPF
jgi:type II secretory pathway pseudopilin PulG